MISFTITSLVNFTNIWRMSISEVMCAYEFRSICSIDSHD
jgi:hypothetical protein